MAEYDNKNTFVLFKNDKQGNEKRPDYSGTIVLEDGTEKQLAAWIRESKNGNKFMSGTISEPYKPKEESAPALEGEDVPF
jgi:uncharacterized protein (DUF736 family)